MNRLFSFVAGEAGEWRILSVKSVTGESIPNASRLRIMPGLILKQPDEIQWILRGITSNERYVTRDEHKDLVSKQPNLGRPEAVCAALIPIRKNAQWWSLSQDERRTVFEEQSNHIKIGMQYLLAVARRLHHCRDAGENEPFDFLTWFEFSSSNSASFEKLVSELRASPEWNYVDREIDIRLIRE